MNSTHNDISVDLSVIPPYDPRPPQPTWSWQRLIAIAGLPCLISVAALDPGNLEVDLQAGNQFGYHLIWALLFSSLIGWILQTLAAHLTIQTDTHLAELCARAYKSDQLLTYALFAVAEISIISFDVAEVVGTAFALQLLFGFPLWLGMLLSALDTMLVLYLQRRGMNLVELIIEGMLLILAICLFYEFLLSRPAISAMLSGALVPSLGAQPREGAVLAIGILGSVIMSHNLFLHSWLVKERRVRDAAPGQPALSPASSVARAEWARADERAACAYASVEAAAIFVATFLINACVLSVTAALPREALAGVVDIGLKDAGALLRNVLGTKFASTAWAVALLCSGHAATVTGTLASQAVCEGFLDLHRDSSSGLVVLATRAVAIVPALIAALIAGEEGSDRLIVFSQVALSFSLPFAVIPIFKALHSLTRTRGTHWQKLVLVGYVAFAILLLANVVAVLDAGVHLWVEGSFLAFGCVVVLGTIALGLIAKLIAAPIQLDDVDFGSHRASLGKMPENQPLLSGKQAAYL